MKFTKILLSTLYFVVHYMLSSVSRYAFSHNYVRIPTLVAYFSTKGNMFTVSQYVHYIHTYHNTETLITITAIITYFLLLHGASFVPASLMGIKVIYLIKTTVI